MSDTKALDHFFDNGNWQSGDDGDWQYEGTIDPHEAYNQLAELVRAKDFFANKAVEWRDKADQLRVDLEEATRKGLLLCNQNGELLMERINLRTDLEEAMWVIERTKGLLNHLEIVIDDKNARRTIEKANDEVTAFLSNHGGDEKETK